MAASTLVGNSIGLGNFSIAQKYARIIMIGSVMVNIWIALVLYFIRWPVASAYISHSDGDSSEVWELTGNTLPFLCIHLVFDLT